MLITSCQRSYRPRTLVCPCFWCPPVCLERPLTASLETPLFSTPLHLVGQVEVPSWGFLWPARWSERHLVEPVVQENVKSKIISCEIWRLCELVISDSLTASCIYFSTCEEVRFRAISRLTATVFKVLPCFLVSSAPTSSPNMMWSRWM